MSAEKKLEIKAITGGRLINGMGEEPIDDATVIIEGSRIKAVGKDIEVPKGAKVIEATGKTIMPGLIDSHMHFLGLKTDDIVTEGIMRPRELKLIQSIYDAKNLLSAGFTTVKDCGGINAVFLRKAADEGTLTGIPRIVAAGYIVTQTYGHGDTHFLPTECVDARTSRHISMPFDSLLCDGVDECIKTTRYAFRQGADFIKVCTTGGVISERDKPTDVQFNLDEIRAIVQTAAESGSFVTAHCLNSLGAERAILGGIKTVDHASAVSEEVVELAKENGTIFVSTLYIARKQIDNGAESGMDPRIIKQGQAQWNPCCESYKRIHKAGAILAAGTDCFGSPLLKLGTNALELELLVNYCDFSPMDAIVAATRNGAMACFIEDKTGTIEPGKFADIIVVDGDPLADIKILQNTEKIRMVMLEGKLEIDRGA